MTMRTAASPRSGPLVFASKVPLPPMTKMLPRESEDGPPMDIQMPPSEPLGVLLKTAVCCGDVGGVIAEEPAVIGADVAVGGVGDPDGAVVEEEGGTLVLGLGIEGDAAA